MVFRGVAQFGSAHALGAWGRRFKSSHPDHYYKVHISIYITWIATWPHGQAVKTPPFHGGNGGSSPPGVTIIAMGEVLAYGPLAQLVRATGS